ncbi:MAG: hypothetical protein KDI37_14515 [Xanthomonadales bacterium]|nr:hypothetical protein [Xanthomonadales bacterium]MCB1642941.1 hypothetical protein [Xanthomonadales bacterium]
MSALLSMMLLSAVHNAAIDCDALLTEQREPAMQLDYQAFDQTSGSGFRVLAEAGCSRQAGDLIEEYMATTGAEQNSLRWHLAQLRGEAGQIDEAIVAARSTLKADEAPTDEFRWNAHVRAYLAFLQQNRVAFDAALAELLAHVQDHQGNAINAGFWRKLEPHFGQGYAAAVRLGMQ